MSEPIYIDTHSHLHFPSFASDVDAVYSRMQNAGVWTVCVGTSAHTSRSGIEFAEKHEGVFASVGYHPEHLTSSYHDASEGEVEKFDSMEIERIASSSKKVVAIGETGLDFFRIDTDRDIIIARKMQEDAFRLHIDIARRLGKPVIIHCREALIRLAEIIREEKEKKDFSAVVHCFTGNWEEAKPLLEMGVFLSFTGIITYPLKKTQNPADAIWRVIERMPLNQMLIETDAPWLAPIPFRGTSNEPTYVQYVAEKIAELRNMHSAEIARITTENARTFFTI